MQSQEIGKLAAALVKAQGTLKGAVKDSKNPFFKSDYADLTSVWDACRDALTSNGLAVVQTTDGIPEAIEVVTTLMHSETGQWISGRLPMRPVKCDPQSIGSAITYARRYGLAAIIGVCPIDDDGNAASHHKQLAPPTPPAKPIPPAPATPPTAPPQPDGDTGRMIVETVMGEVRTKGGQSAQGPWMRFYTKAADGEFYSTFDTKLGEAMGNLAGEQVVLTYRLAKTAKGESRDVLEVVPVITQDEEVGEREQESHKELPF